MEYGTGTLEGLDGMTWSWAEKRVLVTGHTGFKGAWLCLWLQHLGAQVTGVALPPEDPAGTYSALAPWRGLASATVDLRNRDRVREAVQTADPHVIFHLGAQALVRRSYTDPAGTWEVNVLGTANVLEAARRARSLRALIVVTSDKVYANNDDGRPFREDDPLGGKDPYSSSKAGAEVATMSWRHTFFDDGPPRVATARAGNVIGGGDRGEDRLLPDIWRALEHRSPIRLRYPTSTRPWQFVLEPLHGYLLLAQRLILEPATAPSAVNFGPATSDSLPVADLVDRVLTLWGSGVWELITEPQPPEATVLRLDSSLALSSLQWRPRIDLDTALNWTVDWWRAAAEGRDLRKLALTQIESYEELCDQ